MFLRRLRFRGVRGSMLSISSVPEAGGSSSEMSFVNSSLSSSSPDEAL